MSLESWREKQCSKCKETLPLEKFMVSKEGAYGRGSWCKKCHNHSTNEYQKNNREKLKPARLDRAKKYYLKNRDKILNRPVTLRTKARKALRTAVSKGKILKPDICSACRSTVGRKNIDGHHKDYSKPLLVLWLCRFCHIKEHKKVGVRSQGEVG